MKHLYHPQQKISTRFNERQRLEDTIAEVRSDDCDQFETAAFCFERVHGSLGWRILGPVSQRRCSNSQSWYDAQVRPKVAILFDLRVLTKSDTGNCRADDASRRTTTLPCDECVMKSHTLMIRPT